MRLAAIAILTGLAIVATTGAAEESTYTADAFCSWRKATLEVVIVPPAAPYALYSATPSINPDALVVEPQTTLLWESTHATAIVAAVETWERVLHAAAPHLAQVDIVPTVVAPGTDPLLVRHADILVTFSPTQNAGGRMLGHCDGLDDGALVQHTDASYSNYGTHIVMSQWFVFSFALNDTYNIFLHEFGHALGLEHTDAPDDDLMRPVYPYVIGHVDNPRMCPSALNVAQVALGFAWLDGETAWTSPPPDAALPASQYDTCAEGAA